MISSALFSPSQRYRYTLHRVWNTRRPLCAFIGLNPSTAGETVNDRAITRCMGFAGQWGYGGLLMLSLFAYKSTDPCGLYAALDPRGPMNDHYLEAAAGQAGIIIAAWGNVGVYRDRGVKVKEMLRGRLCHLGLTMEGSPKHPLFLPKTTSKELWSDE